MFRLEAGDYILKRDNNQTERQMGKAVNECLMFLSSTFLPYMSPVIKTSTLFYADPQQTDRKIDAQTDNKYLTVPSCYVSVQ